MRAGMAGWPSGRCGGKVGTLPSAWGAQVLRHLLLGLAALLAAVVVLAVSGLLLLGRLDLGAFAAARASVALGRAVTLRSLQVTPGRWLRLELSGLRIDNIAGGSRP